MFLQTAWFRRSARVRDERSAAAILILAAATLLGRLGASTRIYTIDSYIYLAKARSLLEAHATSVPWNDGVDRKFLWGYSVAAAVPVRLFGDAGFVVLACILHALLGVTFFRFLRLVEARASTRLLALALLIFNPLLLWWGSVPASEPLFTLLVLESLRRAILFRRAAMGRSLQFAVGASFFAGLALATRAEGVLFLAVLVLMMGARLWRERKWMPALACAALAVAPEVAHVTYLHAHALATRSTSTYVDELFGHIHDLEPTAAAWENVRAPFWTVFRFDTEPAAYARFFPDWLIHAQAVVAYAYLAALIYALASGLKGRSAWFYSALGICGYALIHVLWYYRYERFMTVMTPFAAWVLASSIDALLRAVLRPRSLRLAWAAVGMAATMTCALYGTRVSLMHATRLAEREDGRDYRGIAAQLDRLDPQHRPILTDLGPYLAYYAKNRQSYLSGVSDFYANGVPWCVEGRELLMREDAAFVVSKEPAVTIANDLDLGWTDYDRVSGSPTLLSLHVRDRSLQPASRISTQVFASSPELGGKLAVERVEIASRPGAHCGELRVKVSVRALAPQSPGDELFVHVNDAEHTEKRLDVERGALVEEPRGADGVQRLDETFIVKIAQDMTTRGLQIWLGMWNVYTGHRLELRGGEGERDGENRLRVGELSASGGAHAGSGHDF